MNIVKELCTSILDFHIDRPEGLEVVLLTHSELIKSQQDFVHFDGGLAVRVINPFNCLYYTCIIHSNY